MFDRAPKLATAVAALGIGVTSLIGCNKKSSSEGLTVPSADGRFIGRVGDNSIYIKEVTGTFFVVVDGFDCNAIIQHTPENYTGSPTKEHSFSAQRVDGVAGDNTLYQVDIDGQKYVIVDGTNSVSITFRK